MKLKKSAYNFIYRRETGEIVIYNTYSKAVVLLNDEEYMQFQTLRFSDNDLADQLLENRILVEADFDEMAFMKYCHYRTKFSNDALHLILATTMDCNFGCPYCYENPRHGKMSETVQNGIIDFIKTHIEKGIRELHVTWYGGEPLLYPDVIRNLSEKLLQLTSEQGCNLKMYIVTNGYLLTADIVDLLDDIGVVRAQITLDGMQQHHDTTRHLRDGRGTFNRIFDNLKLFLDSPIKVDIRMNVDNRNFEDYEALVQKIASLGNPNITVYPSPVEDLNSDTINNISEFMSSREFETFAKSIERSGGTKPAISTVMDDRYCFCNAETENCYVIDELGECYKCWDQVGRLEYSCFNILTPEKRNMRRILDFMGWDPSSDERCSSCVFLPICFGGCKFQRIKKAQFDCGFSDESMRHYIESTFFSQESVEI